MSCMPCRQQRKDTKTKERTLFWNPLILIIQTFTALKQLLQDHRYWITLIFNWETWWLFSGFIKISWTSEDRQSSKLHHKRCCFCLFISYLLVCFMQVMSLMTISDLFFFLWWQCFLMDAGESLLWLCRCDRLWWRIGPGINGNYYSWRFIITSCIWNSLFWVVHVFSP